MSKSHEKHKAQIGSELYIIEKDLNEVGWYFYRIVGQGKITHDYLQSSKQDIIEFAREEFNVPKDSWSRIEIE